MHTFIQDILLMLRKLCGFNVQHIYFFIVDLTQCVFLNNHMIFQPNHMIFQPDHMIFQPNHMIFQPDHMIFQPDHMIFQPNHMIFQPDHMIFQPNHMIFKTIKRVCVFPGRHGYKRPMIVC